MNHPSEQLADLLDGTLDADRRVEVEAHLASCPTCRADLAAATAGREALRSLETIPAPPDLAERISAAVAGGGGAGTRAAPGWYRWAGVAAAAALIAVIAVSLPDIGGGSSNELAGAPEGEAPGAGAVESADRAAGQVPLELRADQNYGTDDLEALASHAATSLGAGEPAPTAAAAADAMNRATACVGEAFGAQVRGRLVQLIRAKFRGKPAYLAVYLEGPGAGQGADTAVVWVADADDCRVLSFAMARR